MTIEERLEIITRLFYANATDYQIGEAVGLSVGTIRYYRRRLRLLRQPSSESRAEPLGKLSDKVIARFWKRVDKQDGCWLWGGNRHRDGYGVITIRGKPHSSHRVSFAIHNGGLQGGVVVRHMCGNKLCVNPSHLQVGSSADNRNDDAKQYEYNGRWMTLTEITSLPECRVNRKQLYERITHCGWSVVKAATTPLLEHKQHLTHEGWRSQLCISRAIHRMGLST